MLNFKAINFEMKLKGSSKRQVQQDEREKITKSATILVKQRLSWECELLLPEHSLLQTASTSLSCPEYTIVILLD